MMRTPCTEKAVPTVDITNDLKRLLLRICLCNVLLNPCYKVILEHALDKLVEDVGCHESMDVGTRKVMCKWLDSVKTQQLACIYTRN